jgi:hypothetical protein
MDRAQVGAERESDAVVVAVETTFAAISMRWFTVWMP